MHMLRTLTTLAVCAALTACSSGGGGGELPGAPADGTATPVTPFTPAQAPVVEAPADDPPPVQVATPPADVTPPAAPVSPSPSPSASIFDLFGTMSLDWTFIGESDTQFTAQANFGPEDINSSAGLTAFGTTGVRSAGQPPIEGLVVPINCLYRSVDNEFLCLVTVGDSRTAFLFDAPVAGRSTGVVEFCNEDTTTEDCAEGLLFSPDGVVNVRIDATTVSTAVTQREGTDLSSYYAYYKQGVPTVFRARSGTQQSEFVSRLATDMQSLIGR